MLQQPWTLSTLSVHPSLCLAGCPARRLSSRFSRIIEPAEGEDPFLPRNVRNALRDSGARYSAHNAHRSPSRPVRTEQRSERTPASPLPPPSSASPLGPHQPRRPPSPLRPRRPTRARNLPRKLPGKTGRSSSPPSYSHGRRAARCADSGEPTSAPKGGLFRIPEGPAPDPNRKPIKTAVSAPGPAPHTALA